MDRYIIKKYIMAKSAKDAIKKDKIAPVQDVWICEDWKRLKDTQSKDIGFK